MSERNGWRSARGHIVFLLALLTAFAVVWWLEQWETGGQATTATWTPDPSTEAPPPAFEALGGEEMESAQAAWAYFESNIQPESGLANSVAGYPNTTMWDTGSFLLAAVAAERLGIVPTQDFDAFIGQALESLASAPLFDGKLPNKAYDTRSLAMVNYANEPTEEGIGWSALDIARALVPLHVLMRDYPQHAAAAAAVIDRWDLAAAVQDGVLMGALPGEEGYTLVQEGRLGYEQYGAKGFALWGFPVGEALRPETHLDWAGVEGIEVPFDRRNPEELGALAPTVSEPYILSALEYGWDDRLADLAALEYGWDDRLADLAWRVYRAQEARHAATGLLTAVTEDHLDRDPRFIFSSVIASGEPWAVLTDAGENAEEFRILSAKAAMGWHALYRTPYTEQLVDAIGPLRTSEGWGAGLYEAIEEPNDVLAANTNAVILESLHYLALGPILHPKEFGKETSGVDAGSALRPEVQGEGVASVTP